jgi:UTP:GlnB (protein PII) uridylyltransferase
VVETADRPGLLVDLVKIITDINVGVQSGEFDTEVVTNFLKIFV